MPESKPYEEEDTCVSYETGLDSMPETDTRTHKNPTTQALPPFPQLRERGRAREGERELLTLSPASSTAQVTSTEVSVKKLSKTRALPPFPRPPASPPLRNFARRVSPEGGGEREKEREGGREGGGREGGVAGRGEREGGGGGWEGGKERRRGEERCS